MEIINKNNILITVFGISLGIIISQGFLFLNKEEKLNIKMEDHSMHTESPKINTEKENKSHGDAHLHVREGLPNPTITINNFKDSMGGYNLQAKTTNFKWTPQDAGKNAEQVGGHGHVYVNDVKVGRLYGEWMHIPKEYFQNGKNIIKVTLNANNHMDWYSSDDSYQIMATNEVEVLQK